ncbi:MAG: DUF3892 domain-containing protein [Clostridia bacterium]
MSKKYNITKVIKNDKNVITQVVTNTHGTITKKQVIRDINNGYSVQAVDKHNHKAPVINVDNRYIKTTGTKNKCNNLSEME